MADNYTQFSEVLPNLTDEEARWLKCRVEPSLEGSGVSYQFDTDDEADGWGRYLWLHAEESADLGQKDEESALGGKHCAQHSVDCRAQYSPRARADRWIGRGESGASPCAGDA